MISQSVFEYSEMRYLFRRRFQDKVKYFTPKMSDNLTTETHVKFIVR